MGNIHKKVFEQKNNKCLRLPNLKKRIFSCKLLDSMAQHNMDWQTALNMWLTTPVDDWVPAVDSSVVEEEAIAATEDAEAAQYWQERHEEMTAEALDHSWIPQEFTNECECCVDEFDSAPYCFYCQLVVEKMCICYAIPSNTFVDEIVCCYCAARKKFGIV